MYDFGMVCKKKLYFVRYNIRYKPLKTEKITKITKKQAFEPLSLLKKYRQILIFLWKKRLFSVII